MDAMKAAALVGYEDRMVLQDSLSAALAKSRYERRSLRRALRAIFPLTDFRIPKTAFFSVCHYSRR